MEEKKEIDLLTKLRNQVLTIVTVGIIGFLGTGSLMMLTINKRVDDNIQLAKETKDDLKALQAEVTTNKIYCISNKK